MLMAKKKLIIKGAVTEVRVVDSRIVIVFVKASSPERIQNKIVRFWIDDNNYAHCLADYGVWAKLAVGDVVEITCIYNGYNTSYELYKLQSEVLDADGLLQEGLCA